MAENADNAQASVEPDVVLKPFVEFWSSVMEQTNENALQYLESFNGSGDPQVWRRRWFDAMSESVDAYMRSPTFLEGMRHNMDSMIKAKSQVNDLSKEVARNAGVPTVSDISGLFERIHSVEETVLSRLGAIESRLEAIEAKLDGETPAAE